jgi:hypothetical protein
MDEAASLAISLRSNGFIRIAQKDARRPQWTKPLTTATTMLFGGFIIIARKVARLMPWTALLQAERTEGRQ